MDTINLRTGGALLLICALAALSTACGGATTEAVTPGRDTVTTLSPPTNVPDALSQVDEAEAELGQALGQLTFAAPASPAQAEQKAPEPSPPPPQPSGDAASERPSSGGASFDPCATACRALASMGRSVEHVCDLAGEGDERCSNARARVGRATERVRAQCPACS